MCVCFFFVCLISLSSTLKKRTRLLSNDPKCEADTCLSISFFSFSLIYLFNYKLILIDNSNKKFLQTFFSCRGEKKNLKKNNQKQLNQSKFECAG